MSSPLPSLCTFLSTGSTFLSQPIWRCQSCGIDGEEALCEPCRDICHAHCRTEKVSDAARAYCDCGSRGPSKCAALGGDPHHQHHANKSEQTENTNTLNVSTTPAARSVSPSAPSSPVPPIPPSTPPGSPPRLPRPRSAQSLSVASATHARSASSNAAGSLKRNVAASSTTTSTPAAAAMAKAALFALPGSITPPPFTSHAAIPSECTYLSTGAHFAAQPIYACYTCNMFDDLAVCYFCIIRCHARHKIAFISDSKRSYCDCGSRCLPKPSTLTSPSAVRTQCHALTPLAYHEAQALSSLCTLTFTGMNFHSQPVFHCLDCGIRDDEICCENCARVCHRGHRIEARGTMRAYCDCSSNGLCQTLDLSSILAATRSNSSSHSVTPRVNLSRRTSLQPQLELTDLSQSSSAVNSRKTSRRTSVTGGGVHTSVGVADAPEEKLDAGSSERAHLQDHLITFTAMRLDGSMDVQIAASATPRANTEDDVKPAEHATRDTHAGHTHANETNNNTQETGDTSTPTHPNAPSVPVVASSPRHIRCLISALSSPPSLSTFLSALDLSAYESVCRTHQICDLESLRIISERELERMVDKKEDRLKLKSGLLALRDRDQTFSPALFAVSTANSAAAAAAANRNEEPSELALPPIADDKEQKKKDYSKVIEGIIKQGVIRHEDEQLLSDLRHVWSLSFADHQSAMRAAGHKEDALEAIKGNNHTNTHTTKVRHRRTNRSQEADWDDDADDAMHAEEASHPDRSQQPL